MEGCARYQAHPSTC